MCNSTLRIGEGLTSPSSASGEVYNDIAEIMITSEVPERRVRRRLGGGGNPLDNSFCSEF